jgi:hypothetical protein
MLVFSGAAMFSRTDSSVTVAATFQEEMTSSASMSSHTYWKLVYFLESNGEIVNSNLIAPATPSALQTIFDLEVSGMTEKYSEFLVTEEVAMELVRVSFLFNIALKQKVAVMQYAEFTNILTQAWLDRENCASTNY